MPGFISSISNSEDAVFAANADFTSVTNQNPLTTNGLQTNGQFWIGSTAVNAGGTHINVGRLTSPDASVTIGYSSPNITLTASTAVGFTWSVITADQAAVVGNGYVCNKAGLLTLTLPATAVVGDIIEVTGINTDLGWKIAQNANQQIFLGNQNTTLGAGGSLASSHKRDSAKLLCVVAGASTVYNVVSWAGNITYV
jgi:hypothetical protein